MRDAQIQNKVEAALDSKGEAVAFTTELNMKRVGGPDPLLPLEELERNADIARARMCYASQKSAYWNRELNIRNTDLSEALLALYQSKRNITDEQLEKNWEHDFKGVFVKKEVVVE